MVRAKELRKLLERVSDDEDIFINIPPIEQLVENDGLLEIVEVLFDEKNDRWIVETEV